MTRTAHVIGLDLDEDGVLLVRAKCETCRATVLHGAGRDLDAPVLGDRLAHCKCREDEPGAVYTLTDPNQIVRLRLRVIRAENPDWEPPPPHESWDAQQTRLRAERRDARTARTTDASPASDH